MSMSTWMSDLKKRDPALAADYALAGNTNGTALRNMVRALSMMPALNTPEENARLAAAKRILRRGG
jgi:hypothetical protein